MTKYVQALLIIATLFILSCDYSASKAQKRSIRAGKSQGDIIIGAVSPWKKLKKEKGWEGLLMAVDELNNRGGVLGRKVKIVKEDDNGSVEKGRMIADKFSKDKDMIAVLGHNNSSVSIATSVLFEYYGILMISPGSEDPDLTNERKNLKHVFRTIPTSKDFAYKLVEYADKKNYKKVIIYCEEGIYGKTYANEFEKRAVELGIDVVDRRTYSYVSPDNYFYNDLTTWKYYYDFDALFISGGKDVASRIIKQIKKADLTTAVFGVESMDSPIFLDSVGALADGMVVPSTFNHDIQSEKVKVFTEKFKKRYQTVPDAEAARWYDTMHLLAKAINSAGTTSPSVVSKTLHTLKNYEGVTGVIGFDKNGDLLKKTIIMKEVVDGKFRYIEQ